MRQLQCTVTTNFHDGALEESALLDVKTGVIELMIENHEQDAKPISIEVCVKGRTEPVFMDNNNQLRVPDEFIQSLIAASTIPDEVIARQRIPGF